MRNSSLSKKSLDVEITGGQKITDESCRDDRVTPRELQQVHDKQTSDILSSAFEQSLSSALEEEALPLPPPPRMDSISSLEDIDLLPPPPPDMVGYDGHYDSHYHVSPVTSPVSVL